MKTEDIRTALQSDDSSEVNVGLAASQDFALDEIDAIRNGKSSPARVKAVSRLAKEAEKLHRFPICR